MASYTAKELERESGFDRRTIAYYVQEGLLPKVGRRGPRTRYPKLFLDRLRFIRRVRMAEETGVISPVTLSDIRDLFVRIPPALIARVGDGRIAVTDDLVSAPSTAFRVPGLPRDVEMVGDSPRSLPDRSAPKDEEIDADQSLEEPDGPQDAAGEPVEERPSAGLRFSMGRPRVVETEGEEDLDAEAESARDAPEADPQPWLARRPMRPRRLTDETSHELSEWAAATDLPGDSPAARELRRLFAPVEDADPADEGVMYDLAEDTAMAPPRILDPSDAADRERRVLHLLALLQQIARERTGDSECEVETWARIRITPEMVLSLRGIGEAESELVARIRRALRAALGRLADY